MEQQAVWFQENEPARDVLKSWWGCSGIEWMKDRDVMSSRKGRGIVVVSRSKTQHDIINEPLNGCNRDLSCWSLINNLTICSESL